MGILRCVIKVANLNTI